MEFKFECPHCGQNLTADAAETGLTGSCPSCSQEFSVPVAPPPLWKLPRWRLLVAIPVGLIFLYFVWMTFGKYLFPKPRYVAAPWSATGSAGSKSSKPPMPKDDRLIVKGLRIGMDADEAVAAIVEQGEGRISSQPTTRASSHGFDLLYKSSPEKTGFPQGGIRMDPETRAVTRFYFEQRLTNLLFNAGDLTPQEFAQRFINAYNVPQLTPTVVWGQQAWRYESPRGSTLVITIDKTVDVSKTPERKFD